MAVKRPLANSRKGQVAALWLKGEYAAAYQLSMDLGLEPNTPGYWFWQWKKYPEMAKEAVERMAKAQAKAKEKEEAKGRPKMEPGPRPGAKRRPRTED